jgi:hypothetical protein
MHTVERLERAIAEAVREGYDVRLEPLNGAAGGLCEFGKRKWIFVDITASVMEQLQQVTSALKAEAERKQPAPAEKKVA